MRVFQSGEKKRKRDNASDKGLTMRRGYECGKIPRKDDLVEVDNLYADTKDLCVVGERFGVKKVRVADWGKEDIYDCLLTNDMWVYSPALRLISRNTPPPKEIMRVIRD